jgi:hypothetical protein
MFGEQACRAIKRGDAEDRGVNTLGFHLFDIIFFGGMAVRMMAVSKASLRVILLASILVGCLFYIGDLVSVQLAGPTNSMATYFAIFVIVRVIAIKIIYTVVDWETV